MGHVACTEPRCLYKGALHLTFHHIQRDDTKEFTLTQVPFVIVNLKILNNCHNILGVYMCKQLVKFEIYNYILHLIYYASYLCRFM